MLFVTMRVGHAESRRRVTFEVEFDQNGRLAAHDVTVVTGGDRNDLRRFEHFDTTIRIDDVDAPLDEEANVSVHAVVSADVRLRVDRPLIARRIDHPLDTAFAGAAHLEPHATNVSPDLGAADVRDAGGTRDG